MNKCAEGLEAQVAGLNDNERDLSKVKRRHFDVVYQRSDERAWRNLVDDAFWDWGDARRRRSAVRLLTISRPRTR